MDHQQLQLQFPIGGLSEYGSYTAQQPPNTTPNCLNVMAHEPATGRNRGGSRQGTSRFCLQPLDVLGCSPQELTQITGFVQAGIELREDGTEELREDGNNQDRETAGTPDAGKRLITILAICDGQLSTVTRTNATEVTNAIASDQFSTAAHQIFSDQFAFDRYFVDGVYYRVYSQNSEQINDWEAQVTAAAVTFYPTSPSSRWTMPRGEDGASAARLICVWNARIVLAGFKTDPTNFYMSAVGDPTNFDYFPPVVTVTQAVAGHLSDAGKPADIITALIPFSDDVLIIGCSHSIERMSGDPADGGRRDKVTDTTGIAFGKAWCMSPEGIIYFMGSRGGVYRMAPGGGIPERLTARAIDERMADLDMNANIFRLVWDDRRMGVWVFITPNPQPNPPPGEDKAPELPTTHYFYDVRNNAWWPIQFGDPMHDPTTVHLMDGYTPEDRAILLGCKDGFIRWLDVDAPDDDGLAIESHVLYGPFSQTLLMELDAIMGRNSGSVNWAVLEGNMAEDASTDENVIATGRFVQGNNPSHWPRRYMRGGYVRLSSTERWQIDALTATVEPPSEHRQRIFY